PTLMLVTPTPVVPTDTPQPEPTVTPEESPTPEATATPTPQPEQPTATPTFSLPTTGFPYTVKKGDNLFRIALRFNTTVAAIASLNGISDPRQIVTGQTLIIPGTPSQMTYVVKPGDTLYSIARRHGTTVQAIVDANNITDRTKIYTGQKLIIPSTGTTPPTTTRTYTVKPGDTLYSIARRHGTTVQAIAQANNLRDPTSIFVGQVLRIP
ncbi:MAG: LysM peptidoglycan-binding domain-containing protein, partial [Anaerolineae bacterium]